MAKILIEVDETILQNVKDSGYEIVEFRTPKVGERVLYDINRISTADTGWNAPRLILKKKFVWPEWLKCRWIAKSPEGVWMAITGNSVFITDDGWAIRLDPGKNCILAIPYSFPDVPWQESLIENPNYGK